MNKWKAILTVINLVIISNSRLVLIPSTLTCLKESCNTNLLLYQHAIDFVCIDGNNNLRRQHFLDIYIYIYIWLVPVQLDKDSVPFLSVSFGSSVWNSPFPWAACGSIVCLLFKSRLKIHLFQNYSFLLSLSPAGGRAVGGRRTDVADIYIFVSTYMYIHTC